MLSTARPIRGLKLALVEESERASRAIIAVFVFAGALLKPAGDVVWKKSAGLLGNPVRLTERPLLDEQFDSKLVTGLQRRIS